MRREDRTPAARRFHPVWRGLLLLIAALPVLTACAAGGGTNAPAPLSVFAAASLTDAFKDLGAQFTAETGIPVQFNLAGSQQLRAQLEQGAAADVFASASEKEMEAAIAAGLVAAGAEQVFARNRLVVILPKANPAGVASLADLAKPGLKLVIADQAVPVGQYTREMLDKMSLDAGFGPDFGARALANVVSYEQNVKAVVSKVQLGEADAGVAYLTDVTPEAAEKVSALAVPDAFNRVAAYPIAPLAKSQAASAAAEFVRYALSEAGQAVLERHGFGAAAGK
jgi:molybdate transport system substrate-binding protein